MPITNGVGEGELTPLKINHLAKIFGMHLAVTQAVLNKNPYFQQQYRYIDLTAGKGTSPTGLQGSPLVFIKQAESDKFKKAYRADLIEKNNKNLRELRNKIHDLAHNNHWQVTNKTHFHLGSYEQTIPNILTRVNRKKLGLAFVDPSGNTPDFDTLQYIAENRPRMEILIYLSTTNLKREYQYTNKLLSDYMASLDKGHWLIRKPISWDSHKWTFLLASNSDIFKDYKSIDFLQLESDEAQGIFPKLNLSKKQRMKKLQPSLFKF